MDPGVLGGLTSWGLRVKLSLFSATFPWASVSQSVSQGQGLEEHELLLHFWGSLSSNDPWA